MSRKAEQQALLALLPSATTKSRTLRHWNDTPPDQRPAYFLAYVGETIATTGRGALTRRTATLKVYVYVTADDPATTPAADLLADHVDAIQAALKPPPGIDAVMLGTAVSSVRITTIETDEGTLGTDAVAILTLEVTAAP